MAIVTIPEKGIRIEAYKEAREFLASYGIVYATWGKDRVDGDSATPDEILSAYAGEIEELKRDGGYTTADVIDMRPDTPAIESMLEKFRKEHTHSEDEVRYTVKGRGIFHVHSNGGDVISIEVHEGDLISIPRGTRHWFNLCGEKRIRAIRLFQDRSGWTPHYTDSGIDSLHQPVCLGPYYFQVSETRR